MVARLAVCGALLVAAACSSRNTGPGAAAKSAPVVAAPGEAAPPPPRLVVVIVVDQLAYWVLERTMDLLPADGAIRRWITEGAYLRASYPYASTFTGPGHAALFTGAAPKESGVLGNTTWSRSLRAARPVVSDPAFPMLEGASGSASPRLLRLPTVGDRLKARSDRARVAALSYKDRAAIIAGGRRADVALWYDPSIPGFTTSSYYAPDLPEWFSTWQHAHPVELALGEWTPLHPDRYERLGGADDTPGEGGWRGLGSTFPHDPRRTDAPYSTFRATPQSTDYLLALAEHTIASLGLGQDDAPDLLTVSISATDYVGHVFGPQSWEALDTLVRLDRALGDFARAVTRSTSVAFVLTSDHGVAPLPERSANNTGRRVTEDEVERMLQEKLEADLGAGPWVEAVSLPFVYLSDSARSGPAAPRALRLAEKVLRGRPDVQAAVDIVALRRTGPASELERAIYLSIDSRTDADLYVELRRDNIFDPGFAADRGTNHGTNWEYDREVPVIVWGPGVRRSSGRAIVDALRVAPTIAALLGMPPEAGGASPLPVMERAPNREGE